MKKVTITLAAVVMVIVIAVVAVANTTGGIELINDVMLACSDCMIDRFNDALACSDCMIDRISPDTQLS